MAHNVYQNNAVPLAAKKNSFSLRQAGLSDYNNLYQQKERRCFGCYVFVALR